MKILIRAAFAAMSLATITPVASAAIANASRPPVQQDFQIGLPGAGWG
jgi:Spy/CpxP family protein refolding chaperone